MSGCTPTARSTADKEETRWRAEPDSAGQLTGTTMPFSRARVRIRA